jgi:hypothetical protein
MDQEAMFVLGPHRTGTSTVAGLLKILGVDLGSDEELMPAHPTNPKGFFEHIGLNEVNILIMEKFGGVWFRPPSFVSGWESSSEMEELRNKATEVLERAFGKSPLWGFKDPRTCLLFPFWRSIIRHPIRCVIVVRNPLDASLSLLSRNGTPIEEGATLWLSHIKGALRGSQGLARHIVIYEDLLAHFDQELNRLAEFVGRAIDPEVRLKARDFVEPSLQHHQTTSAQMKAHPELPKAAREAYMAMRLLAHSVRKGETDFSTVDDVPMEST